MSGDHDLAPSPIFATVDFERDGVQHGFLRLPYSRDDSAWGSVLTPITVIGHGDGPTALLTGGNHGDEYEGPIALFDVARSLAPDAVTGRVIIVPALNYPAFRAGTRTSPKPTGRDRPKHSCAASSRPSPHKITPALKGSGWQPMRTRPSSSGSGCPQPPHS